MYGSNVWLWGNRIDEVCKVRDIQILAESSVWYEKLVSKNACNSE